MRNRTTLGFLFVLAAALPAFGQTVHTPAKPGAVAAIAPAPPPPPPPGQAYFPQGQSYYPPPGRFLYGSIPVVVFPDGRIYADFGWGWEPVTRNCAVARGYATPPAPQVPAVVQPQVIQPQAGVNQTTPNPPASQALGSQSCWSMDARGQVVITR